LLDIVDLISEAARPVRPAMSSGIGQRPSLQRRLVDLMKRRCVPTMTPLARRVILAAAAVSLACHPSLFVTPPPKVNAATASNLADSARRTLANPPVAAGLVPARRAPSPPLVQSVPFPGPTEANTETTDEPQDYDEPRDYPWATAISPNGRFHITVRRGYECELHEVTSDQVRRLSDHRITCVAFTADSARFVTGDLQGTVRVWDSASGEVLQSLTRREGPVHSVCMMPSGDYAAVAGHDGVVELVSLVSAEDRRVVAHTGAPVRCVRFSPDGSSLIIATDTWKKAVAGAIEVYDVATRTCLHHWNVAGPLGATDFPSQDRVVTVEWSGRVRQWKLPGLAATDLPPIAKELVSAASFSVDTRVLEDLGH
jgi:WD40 repeat protein